MGARSVNMLARKREEIRLSFWLEREMWDRFGSKRRAKEEILARYAGGRRCRAGRPSDSEKGIWPADIDRHTSLEPDTVFDRASVARQFTGVALLMLAQRSSLSMHDDIRTYLPEPFTEHRLCGARLLLWPQVNHPL